MSFSFYLVNQLGAGGGLPGLGGIGRETTDKGLQLCNLGFFPDIFILQPLTCLSGSCHILIVVSGHYL